MCPHKNYRVFLPSFFARDVTQSAVIIIILIIIRQLVRLLAEETETEDPMIVA